MESERHAVILMDYLKFHSYKKELLFLQPRKFDNQ